MNWNDFYKAIRDDDLAPVYVFTGAEEYIKREALQALRSKLLPAGMELLNDATLEGATAQQIIDAAETMPMMCERRILTVRDWAPLTEGKSKDEEAEAARMLEWLAHPAPSCVLIFYMRKSMDERKKVSQQLKKAAEIVSFDPLGERELARWCAGRLKPYGKSLNNRALNALTLMAGGDLNRLVGELDKLASYVEEDRAEITAGDVEAVVTPTIEYKAYQIIDRLLSRDMQSAQQIVNSMVTGRNDDHGIRRLMATLTRQVRQLTHIRCALDASTPLPMLQTRLGISPGAAKANARQCKNLPARWLIGLYRRCVELDYASKNGGLSAWDALNAMILEIGLSDRNGAKNGGKT